MIVTILVSLLAVYFAYINGNSRFRTLYGLQIAFVIIFIYMSLRYDFGNDYIVYMHNFEKIGEGIEVSDRLELGWVLLCQYLQPVGFWGFIIFFSGIYCFILYKYIKKYVSPKWYWVAVFIFTFNVTHMVLGLTMMRQFMAMMLFLLATKFIIEKKLKWYLLIMLVATQIHSSALLLFPMYFIVNREPKYDLQRISLEVLIYLVWYFSAYYVMGEAIGPIITMLDFNKYETYLQEDTSSKLAITLPFDVLMYICLLLKFNKLSRDLKIFINLIIVGFYLLPVVPVAPLMGRLVYYFSFFSIFVYPVILNELKEQKMRWFILSLLILINVYRFVGFFHNEVWYDTMYEYKTIFEVEGWK